MRKITRDQVERLTALQKECLRLVAQGLRSKEIAAAVKRSHRTVDTYITSALPIFGTTDRRDAARMLVAYEASVEAQIPASEGSKPAAADVSAEVSQRLLSQSETVAEPLNSVIHGLRADGEPHGLRRLFRVPPIGGVKNDLRFSDRILSIAQVAFAGAMVLLAITAIVQGIIHLLT